MRKKDLLIIAALICALIIISGCAKPPSLRDEFQGTKKVTETTKDTATDQSEKPDETTDQEDSTQETTESTTTKEVPEEEGEKELTAKDILRGGVTNIAKIKTLGESSEVDATFFGINEVFTVPYTDIDAIIFDISKTFGVTLDEVRLVLEVDGNPYLRPTQKEALETEVKGQESVFNETDSNPYEDLPYTFTRDDDEPGYIRAVGCDMANNVVKFKIHNYKDVVVQRYRDVKPRIKDPFTVYFNNKRLLDSYCGGVMDIQPNQTIECFHSGVKFIQAEHEGSIYEDINYNPDYQDELHVTQPGYTEEFKFVCTPEAAQAEESPDSQE